MRDPKEVVRECRATYPMPGAVEIIEADRRAAKLEVLRELAAKQQEHMNRNDPRALPNWNPNSVTLLLNAEKSWMQAWQDMIAELEKEG